MHNRIFAPPQIEPERKTFLARQLSPAAALPGRLKTDERKHYSPFRGPKFVDFSRWAMSMLIVALVISSCSFAVAQQVSPDLLKSLHWRSIGPFRGGRTRAVAGVASKPNVFYVAAVNGRGLKTTDYGHPWAPIFDEQPTGSVGSIAVAASNADIIYVGSGEGLHRPDLSVGDGIYKSTDAGKSWTHLGLRDGQQIPQIAVDPRDPDRLLVAVAGHPYGSNKERG